MKGRGANMQFPILNPFSPQFEKKKKKKKGVINLVWSVLRVFLGLN